MYHCNLLVTYGIAQTYLCIQIRTLCVEHVKIAYYTVHILQLCQLYALLCRLFPIGQKGKKTDVFLPFC